MNVLLREGVFSVQEKKTKIRKCFLCRAQQRVCLCRVCGPTFRPNKTAILKAQQQQSKKRPWPTTTATCRILLKCKAATISSGLRRFARTSNPGGTVRDGDYPSDAATHSNRITFVASHNVASHNSILMLYCV